MASGVVVLDEVILAFNDMKVRKNCSPEEAKMRKKFVMLRLSDDERTIMVDKENELLVGEIGNKVPDPYNYLINKLPKNDCRYILYDASYETKESKKEDIVFIVWVPETTSIKQKMIYASSKGDLRKKCPGCKFELQINTLEDLIDRRTMADKLGSNVMKLEGKPL